MIDSSYEPLVSQYRSLLSVHLSGNGDVSPGAVNALGTLACNFGISAQQLVLIHAEALAAVSSLEAVKTPAHFDLLVSAVAALEQGYAKEGSPARSHCSDSESAANLPLEQRGTLLTDTRRRRAFLSQLSERILCSREPKDAIGEVVNEMVPQVADCVALHWVEANGHISLEERCAPNGTHSEIPCGGQLCHELAREAVTSRRVVSLKKGNAFIRNAIALPFVADGRVLGTLSLCQMSDSLDFNFVREFGEQMTCCTRHAFESARYRAVAQSSHKFLDEYLNRAIHDLSSPLGTLSLVLEIGLSRLEAGGHPNESSLRRAQAQVEQMTSILKDLLESTRAILDESKSSATCVSVEHET